MRIFNLDGSEGMMCGNGIRCVAKYMYDKRKVFDKSMTIETKSGVKRITVETRSDRVIRATVDMGEMCRRDRYTGMC